MPLIRIQEDAMTSEKRAWLKDTVEDVLARLDTDSLVSAINGEHLTSIILSGIGYLPADLVDNAFEKAIDGLLRD